MILQTPPPYQKDSLLLSTIKKPRVASPEPHSSRSRKTYHSSPPAMVDTTGDTYYPEKSYADVLGSGGYEQEDKSV